MTNGKESGVISSCGKLKGERDIGRCFTSAQSRGCFSRNQETRTDCRGPLYLLIHIPTGRELDDELGNKIRASCRPWTFNARISKILIGAFPAPSACWEIDHPVCCPNEIYHQNKLCLVDRHDQGLNLDLITLRNCSGHLQAISSIRVLRAGGRERGRCRMPIRRSAEQMVSRSRPAANRLPF